MLILYEQPHRANIRVTRGGDIPTGWAGFVPTYLQCDVVPAVREQCTKTLAGVYAVAAEHQTGMRVSIVGIGKF